MMSPRELWRSIPPKRRRLGVYVALVGLAGAGLLRQQATLDELHALVEAEAAEEEVEQAAACVTSHERYSEVRGVIRDATIAGADLGAGAVAAVAGASPEQTESGLAYIERNADAVLGPIVARYEPPACDLDEARRVVAGDRRARAAE